MQIADDFEEEIAPVPTPQEIFRAAILPFADKDRNRYWQAIFKAIYQPFDVLELIDIL